MTRRVSMSVNNRRPIDRRDSNAARMIGGALNLAVLAFFVAAMCALLVVIAP